MAPDVFATGENGSMGEKFDSPQKARSDMIRAGGDKIHHNDTPRPLFVYITSVMAAAATLLIS